MHITLKEPSFVQVGGRYGYDQNMLAGLVGDFFRYRACGVAALAGLVDYEGAVHYRSLSQGKFFLLEVFRALRPRPWGVVGIHRYRRALRELGISGRFKVYDRRRHGSELSFLIYSLMNDHPVAVLQTNHPHPAFRYHWVIVTELEERGGEWWVYFSSWGKKYKLKSEIFLAPGTMLRTMATLECPPPVQEVGQGEVEGPARTGRSERGL
ncbi:MAG: hypothetical protein Q4E76_01270 [Tissierellia bacterium]|nr:hypothetical protein [Tissierellia bacterium]